MLYLLCLLITVSINYCYLLIRNGYGQERIGHFNARIHGMRHLKDELKMVDGEEYEEAWGYFGWNRGITKE